jgi:hypothetical protein
VVAQLNLGISPNVALWQGFPMRKPKSKGKRKAEKRDFAQSPFSVFQKGTGFNQAKPRHSGQHHTRSGRGK